MSDQKDWERLLELYQNVEFGDGQAAHLTIANDTILQLLREVDQSEELQQRFNIVVDADLSQVALGTTIDLLVGATLPGIGLLVKDPEAFLHASDVRFREPPRFYVKSDGTNNNSAVDVGWLQHYRSVLDLVRLVGECSLFVDETRQEIVFFKDGRLPIPVTYSQRELSTARAEGIRELMAVMTGDLHTEQRREILAQAISSGVSTIPRVDRFVWIIRNAADLALKVRNGYRLFASSFSYEKIRGDVQKAQSEYLGRIHKTFVDIQGQLLGLPIATVVVASQLKDATGCGMTAWSNLAILGGSYLFVLLFLLSCINQGYTLFAISKDVSDQRRQLTSNYAPVSEQFVGVFDHLRNRIGWHYIGLFLLCFVALSGAVLTTMAFLSLTDVNPLSCSR